MKNLSPSRQSLIMKVLGILVNENEKSVTGEDANSSETNDGREYLLDDNEQQILHELKKLLNRED